MRAIFANRQLWAVLSVMFAALAGIPSLRAVLVAYKV